MGVFLALQKTLFSAVKAEGNKKSEMDRQMGSPKGLDGLRITLINCLKKRTIYLHHPKKMLALVGKLPVSKRLKQWLFIDGETLIGNAERLQKEAQHIKHAAMRKMFSEIDHFPTWDMIEATPIGCRGKILPFDIPEEMATVIGYIPLGNGEYLKAAKLSSSDMLDILAFSENTWLEDNDRNFGSMAEKVQETLEASKTLLNLLRNND